LKNYGEITFQGGEPTILPEFEDLLNLFIEKKCKIRIHSSGIKYSLAIEKCLMQNLATVVISPDTAKKETYEKIKRVPCFDKVWDNIKKYSSVQIQSNLVKIKFIIIPGINDTVEEIDKFLEKCIESGIHNVIWEIEDRYTGMYNYDVPHACLLIDYAMNEAQKYGLEDEFYDGAIYSMKMRTNQKATITNKEDFEKMYNEEKAKYKDRECDYLQFLI
jgi:molybdenum cofactor biosynthesis enzyme MoaA